MDVLNTVEAMEPVLPRPVYVVGAFVFGMIGHIVFRRGRKTERPLSSATGAQRDESRKQG
ncbi:MAG: hypothetical protein D4R79_00375 [Comamonadaceae bacterium]|nr:MAG: hypothetical protein D4R79_00375 [Comamonadaceae bacterium]